MNVIGKRVTVTVKGFGSKEGVIDDYAPNEHRMRPYHVVFDDGMDGYFDGFECGFLTWASVAEASRPTSLQFAALSTSVVATGGETLLAMGDGSLTAHHRP